MANKYAVASHAWSSTDTWSDTDGGSAGATVPADDDAVFILAGVSVLMDADQSAFTGLRTVTIRGSASTPGQLHFADGTNGWLKLRTGYNIVGTSGTNKGRLLANSNGTWGGTTGLAIANTAMIDLQGTAKIDAQYLDIALYCTQPTNLSVRTYKDKYDFTAGAGTVDTTNDTIDLGVTPPAAGTAVMITTAAGTLPTGLVESYIYYVRGVSGTKCKLATYNSDSCVVDITGTGSGTCSVFTGHTDTGTATMNVLENVTADSAWTTTDEWDRVVLVSRNTSSYDQQRLQLTTINAGTIVLSANVDSTQSPGARIWLVSRNVTVRSTGTSSSQAIIDYTNATTSAGVFQCAVINTGGTGTTFYGYGLNYGTGHTVSGTVSGCNYGLNSGTGHTVSGTVSGCNNGLYAGTGHTVSGTVSGCNGGLNYGTGHTVSGKIGYNAAGDSAPNGTDFYYPLDVICRGALLPTSPVFGNRNAADGSSWWTAVGSEDHGRTLGESKAWQGYGTITKNATTRPGGASSSLLVEPLSNCSTSGAGGYPFAVQMFEWTELSVPASAQARSVFMRGNNWSTFPTATQLYVEAEYVSNATTFARTTVASTGVLVDNTTWTEFTLSFAPAAAAHVRYRGWLKTYASSAGVYVDARLC